MSFPMNDSYAYICICISLINDMYIVYMYCISLIYVYLHLQKASAIVFSSYERSPTLLAPNPGCGGLAENKSLHRQA